MPSIAVCNSSATHVWSRRGSGAPGPGIDVSRRQRASNHSVRREQFGVL